MEKISLTKRANNDVQKEVNDTMRCIWKETVEPLFKQKTTDKKEWLKLYQQHQVAISVSKILEEMEGKLTDDKYRPPNTRALGSRRNVPDFIFWC